MSFVFPSGQRIKKSNDFEQALRQKSLINKWFTIHVVDSDHKFARLGMIASKRIMPKSVHRNFAKRFIRETFRLNSSELAKLDFVVRIRRNLTNDMVIEARTALLQLMFAAK